MEQRVSSAASIVFEQPTLLNPWRGRTWKWWSKNGLLPQLQTVSRNCRSIPLWGRKTLDRPGRSAWQIGLCQGDRTNTLGGEREEGLLQATIKSPEAWEVSLDAE